MDQPGSASGSDRSTDAEQTPGATQTPHSEQPVHPEQQADSVQSDGTDSPRAFTETAKLGAGIAVIGIVGTGLLDFLLSQYSSPAAGRLVWAVGFTLTILVLWYVVLRPMEITGP